MLHAPRNTPRQERSAAMAEALKEAGRRVLETEGVEGYTTKRVAEVAGASIGSFYQRFANKEALTAAIIRDARMQALNAMLAASARADELDADGALEAMATVPVDAFMARPRLYRALQPLLDELRMHEETQACLLDERTEAAMPLARVIAPGVGRDRVKLTAAAFRGVLAAALAEAPPRNAEDMKTLHQILRTRMKAVLLGILRPA